MGDIGQPPNATLPEIFGLFWGMPKTECVKQVPFIEIEREAVEFIRGSVVVNENDQPLLLSLLFDDKGLYRVHVDWKISQAFLESTSFQEIELVQEEFTRLYHELVLHYSSSLGHLEYSGFFGQSNYPSDEESWQLAYWKQGETQFQIELDHPDRDYPFYLRFSWRPVLR